LLILKHKFSNSTSKLNASSALSLVMHFAIAKLWGKLYFRSVNGTGVPALRSPLSNWINLVLLWLINTSRGGKTMQLKRCKLFDCTQLGWKALSSISEIHLGGLWCCCKRVNQA